MKPCYYFLLPFLLFSCQQPLEKDDLLGTWDMITLTDLETGEEERPQADEEAFVVIRTDSIYSSDGLGYAWELDGDSIRIEDIGAVYIKKLTSEGLTVEYNILSEYRLTLRKRK